jgi:hypothetical protein
MRKKPLDVDTLWRLETRRGGHLSPDGAAAVCTVTSYSMQDNKGRTSLWLLADGRVRTAEAHERGEKTASPAGRRKAIASRSSPSGSRADTRTPKRSST